MYISYRIKHYHSPTYLPPPNPTKEKSSRISKALGLPWDWWRLGPSPSWFKDTKLHELRFRNMGRPKDVEDTRSPDATLRTVCEAPDPLEPLPSVCEESNFWSFAMASELKGPSPGPRWWGTFHLINDMPWENSEVVTGSWTPVNPPENMCFIKGLWSPSALSFDKTLLLFTWQ